MVCFSAYDVHHDPEIFSDPEAFKYGRFLRDKDTNLPPSFFKEGKKIPYSHLVFSEGKHKCPGRFFAMDEIKVPIPPPRLAFLLVFKSQKSPFS